MVTNRSPRKIARPGTAAWLAAALCGCARAAATPAVVPMKVSVPVPVPVYCAESAPARPALEIASLVPDSPPADTVRAYAASVVILKAAVVERDRLLRACAAPRTQGKHGGEIHQ